ncbi:MAG: AmmeMemoRadiSam system radical SAM enzyme [Candidatus Kapaibacterium sp.]
MTMNGNPLARKDDKPTKFSHKAFYYTKDGDSALCHLCPNECIIRPGEVGDCRVRKNFDGELFSLAYGNACALHVDPIEKKPLFHFLPKHTAMSVATAGCNFSCLNCQNWSISQASPEDTRSYDVMPEKLIAASEEYNCDIIAYTYTEPIIFYEYMYNSAKLARERGIRNVMISNGYINERPLRNLCKVIDAANIDLKSFDDKVYRKLTGGGLNPILRTLKILHEKGVWLEITNLIVPGWTDDMKTIEKMCKWITDNGMADYPIHFSRFTPLYKLTNVPPTPVSTMERAAEIATKAGIKYVYLGNVPGNSHEDTNCHNCGEKIIDRHGFTTDLANFRDGHCGNCGQSIPGVWK